MRILLAEDHEKVARHIAAGLREEGCTVEVAADGPGALWLASEQSFDALVLDINLPGTDGILTAARAEQGQLTAQVTEMKWRPFVADFVETYGRLAGEEGRRLVVGNEAGEVVVRVDEARLRQVLHNLLDNALRHGEGDILWSETRRDGRLELVVENAASHPVVKDGLGIGLRLATALAAIQPHGSLQVEPSEGRFRVRLELEAA